MWLRRPKSIGISFLVVLCCASAVAQGPPPIVWMGGGHAGSINPITVSTDGSLWTASPNDRTFKKWTLPSLTLSRTLLVDFAQNSVASISGNGQRVAVRTSAGIGVFQTSDGALLHTYPPGNYGIGQPSLSADGQTISYEVSTSGPNFIVVGSLSLGTQLTVASTTFGFGLSAVTPDGSTVVVRDPNVNGTLNLYRASDAAFIRGLAGNTGVNALAFSMDSDRMSAVSGPTIRIWRLSDVLLLQSITAPQNPDNSTPNIVATAFSPDGTLLASVDSTFTRVWNVSTGTSVTTIQKGGNAVDFTPDGQTLVVAGSDARLHEYAVSNGAAAPATSGHTGAVTAVAYSPTGSMVASASVDQTIELRSAVSGNLLATLSGHTGSVNSVAFSPAGNLLVSGSSDNMVKVWDTSTYALVRTLTGHTNAVRSVAFSPDGAQVASGSDAPEQTVKLWTVSSGTNTRTLTGSADSVTSIAFSPDGQGLAGGSQAGVGRLWNVSTGSVIKSYLAPGGGAMSLAFSPNGQQLAAGWTSKVLIFDSAQGTLLQTIDAHSKDGTVVSYAPDGLRVLSGNSDGTLKIWNTSNWSLVSTYDKETYSTGSGVTSVRYSADNTRFVYGRGDATSVLALTGSTSINPTYTVTTNPSGLAVIIDGSTLTSPQTFTNWASGSNHTIAVTSPQGTYAFGSWSDGGAQSHGITAAGVSTAYTANFVACTYSIAPIGQTFTAAGGSGMVNVTAGSGCPWTAVSSIGWVHVTSGASGTGNGPVNFTVDPNGGSQRSNPSSSFLIAGKDFTATQSAPAANQVPTVTSLSPVVSTGASQSFTFQFSDPDGWQDLGVLNVLINSSLDGRQACYLAYSRSDNVLYLVNDNGDALLPSLVLNGSGTLGNSQCTVTGSGSAASGTGNTLTLTLNLSFSSAFAGNKVMYLAARDSVQNNSGWQTMGVHGVPPLPVTFPSPVSMSPSSGLTANPTLTFTFQDASTANNLQTGWALINTAIDGRGACFVAYYRPGNQVFLYPDNGDGTQATSMVLTGTNTVSNGQCTVSAQGSSVTTTGTQLIVSLNITLKAAFAGPKGVWMAAQTVGGAQTSPWQAFGAWRAP